MKIGTIQDEVGNVRGAKNRFTCRRQTMLGRGFSKKAGEVNIHT